MKIIRLLFILLGLLGLAVISPAQEYQGWPIFIEATVASASTITMTGSVLFITGTTAIATITPNSAVCITSGADCSLLLIADKSTGPFTLTTAGNIALAQSPPAGGLVLLIYNPATSLWYPDSALLSTVARGFGADFGSNVTGASPLTSGSTQTVYQTIPYACTIKAYSITAVPADTITFDIWIVASGTVVPTVANTIVSTGPPALSTGSLLLGSTAVSGWTAGTGLNVTANSVFAINIKAVGGTATSATLNVECDQTL